MHNTPFPLRDAADRPEASYTPDLTSMDAINDRFADALSLTLRRWRGRLPESREEFVKSAVEQVVIALEDQHPESFGSVLRGLIEIQVAAERAEAVLHTIALILDRDNPALTTDCIAFAAGLHTIQKATLLDDEEVIAPSQSELAFKHGVDRQTINNRVTDCQEALGLPTGRGGKSEEARDTYKERAHQVHGTEQDPGADALKKTRTVVAAVDRVVQWFATGNLAKIGEDNRALLKRAFARLTPAFEAVAML